MIIHGVIIQHPHVPRPCGGELLSLSFASLRQQATLLAPCYSRYLLEQYESNINAVVPVCAQQCWARPLLSIVHMEYSRFATLRLCGSVVDGCGQASVNCHWHVIRPKQWKRSHLADHSPFTHITATFIDQYDSARVCQRVSVHASRNCSVWDKR